MQRDNSPDAVFNRQILQGRIMDETEFLQQLALHIQAHYPMLFIETPDDDWIVESLKSYFGQVFDVETIAELDPAQLELMPEKPRILHWVGATIEDWRLHARVLLRHAHRLRTNVLLILQNESWADLPDMISIPPILRAPLPSQRTRENIAQLALGASTADPMLISRITFASAGMTRTQLFRALSKALVYRRQDAAFDAWEQLIVAEKKTLMSRSSTLEIINATTRLEDVGGSDELKIWLKQRNRAFSAQAHAFGLESPRGLLLVGIQGCGKSLLAKSIATDWHFPLLRLDMSSIFAGTVGNPDAALARALDVADAMAPAVIWCDEIEKSFNDQSDPTTRRLLGHILNWLQERQSKTFFVATANDVQALPPELTRKGRFDEIFFIDLPDEKARREIFNIHLRRRRRDPNRFDCEKLAAQAVNFSGAEIEQAIMSALFSAFNQDREITTDDIIDAIHDTTPLYKQREEDIKRLREWAGERTRSASQNERILSFFN